MAGATSLGFLMALMRSSSGAIGLEPSASTAASSRPLAQKSPSSFCTLPCGVRIALSSSARCCSSVRSRKAPSTLTEPASAGTLFFFSQSALVAV